MATVLLLALTLAVGGILGSWFVSMSKTETASIEGKYTTLVNCTGALDIVDVTCNGTTNELKVAVQNLLYDINLYNFSTSILIGNKLISNSTGGPNKESSLGPGQQTVLTYDFSSTTFGVNSKVTKVRVSTENCPVGWFEKDVNVNCTE